MHTTPLVSVCCITYNQEEFIKDALDGFIMQKTDFPFEVIVSDDKSTDGTRKIIKEYAERFPDIIKPVFHKKNMGSLNNYRDNFLRATGKYVAMCEGDDYWTDPNKLQRQVDYMEKNPGSALCFHPVTAHYEEGGAEDFVFPSEEQDFTLSSLLEGNFIQTNSVMYRRQKKYTLAKSDFVPGDWYLHLYHARLGEIGFINSAMAVYRKHRQGMWAGDHEYEFWNKYATRHLEFCKQLLKLFSNDDESRQKIINLSSRVLYEVNKSMNSKSDLMERIQKQHPLFVLEYITFLRRIIDEKDAQITNATREIGSIRSLAKLLLRKLYRKVFSSRQL